jgi:NADH-quinone oxidoreductase subunit G
LEAHGLEPKLTPFDPMAILDEIQRLVPGYDVSRKDLLVGNDQHTRITGPGAWQDPSLIVPARDGLFTSGTLGRYSNTLNSVIEHREAVPAGEVAAD